MNIYIIIGIIVIGIGTLLIYYGSGKNDRQSQQEITDKIEDTQRKIEQLKSNSNVNQEDLVIVENEFANWAKDFVESKEHKKLELEKSVLGEKESRLKLNSLWKPQLNGFLQETKNLILAYNSNTGDSINFEIPDLPENIFLSKTDQYKAKIIFRPDVRWEISIAPAGEYSQNAMIDFRIEIYNDTLDKYESKTEFLAFVLNIKRIQIVTIKNSRLNLKNIAETFEFSDNILQEIARTLIENQLLQIK